jgi:hypothetical protein
VPFVRDAHRIVAKTAVMTIKLFQSKRSPSTVIVFFTPVPVLFVPY